MCPKLQKDRPTNKKLQLKSIPKIMVQFKAKGFKWGITMREDFTKKGQYNHRNSPNVRHYVCLIGRTLQTALSHYNAPISRFGNFWSEYAMRSNLKHTYNRSATTGNRAKWSTINRTHILRTGDSIVLM